MPSEEQTRRDVKCIIVWFGAAVCKSWIWSRGYWIVSFYTIFLSKISPQVVKVPESPITAGVAAGGEVLLVKKWHGQRSWSRLGIHAWLQLERGRKPQTRQMHLMGNDDDDDDDRDMMVSKLLITVPVMNIISLVLRQHWVSLMNLMFCLLGPRS